MAMERHLTDKTDSSLSSASRQALRLPRCRLVRDGVVSLEMSMWQGATRMWRVAPPPRLPRCDRRPVWPMCRPVRDSVPRNLRQTVGHTVEFQVLVRKYIGDERRVRVQTQLFRSVTDAEFRMTVDPTLGVERLFTAASEVSAIGVARGGSAESTFVEPFDQHAGIVRLPFPLQAGSSVAFTLDCIGETS